MTDRPLEHFRTSIISDQIEEVYLAAAEAVKRMHKLHIPMIDFELQGDYGGQGVQEFVYEAGHPEKSAVLNTSSSADMQVEWTVIPSVKIKKKVLAAWRDVAFDRGTMIKFYLIDDPEELYDYQLIE